MDCSMPGFPALQLFFPVLPELAQTHVHRIGDVIQPSHPLLFPSPTAFNLSQHQGLFKWVGCLHQVAQVLELQHQSFQRIFRTNFLYDWLAWSPCCPRDSQESSPAPQLESINSLTLGLSLIQRGHPYMTTGKAIALTTWNFVGKVISFLFNTLSWFVLAFLPRSKCLLISRLQLPSAVILEPKMRIFATASIFSPLFARK